MQAGGGAPAAVAAGIGRAWCRTYDLTKSMGAEQLSTARLECHACAASTAGGAYACVQEALTQALAFVRQLRPKEGAVPGLPVAQGPESVGRLVVQSLGGPLWWRGSAGSSGGGEAGVQGGAPGCEPCDAEDAQQAQVLVRAMLQLRLMVQETRASALVTVPAGLLTRSVLLQLQHAADAVLLLQPISDDSEVFALLPDAPSACALLCVAKLPAAGMLTPRLPDPNLYVVRNKRRRLAITVVDVDPDAEARQQEQQQAAAASAGPAAAPDAKAQGTARAPAHGNLDF